jgi:GNAT superfamily N-acetyltransferase
MVVADDWQGRGLGTELARRLSELARERGVTAFTGSMQADNRPAVGLLASQAPAADRRLSSGELEFLAPLAVPRRSAAEPLHRAARRPAA